ncbi:hypothetical protein EVAR_102084_1 [Eumeta japonica]|uniref:ATP-dependent DNA helicase n=1 Tax=Eumeta variegata TaxID=151549 RepID=A0A4C1U136_EUMVA|nr:hypothetical protein EVAR_102084_1 [Eumeta japonica]
MLHPGHTSADRHDITARVFKQKLQSLTNYIVKQRVFGTTRCCMYSIEWQKRGLPHAHILLWLVERIQSDQIDDIICAEIPDPITDPELHDVVSTNIIHGPCGAISPQSPCMVNGKCSKCYPRQLTAETITGNDGYPLHRRRSPDDNGRSITTKVKGNDVVVDNMHLENGQRVYFTASNAAQRAETPPATTLTSFFEICQSDLFARTLLYSKMPRYYTWNASTKKFHRRKQGDVVLDHPGMRSTDALGRIYTVHHKNDECFYLRLLLVNARGPTSFESLRTVNGVVYPTVRAACQELNLLENDNHRDTTLAEASISASPCTLFSIIFSTCFPSNPSDLWNKYKDNMSKDMLHQICVSSRSPDLEATRLGMPAPARGMNDVFTRELEREHDYDRHELSQSVQPNVPLLNPQQREVYGILMKAVDDGDGSHYSCEIRHCGSSCFSWHSDHIVRRLPHSALKLPLNLETIEQPTCNIAKNSAMTKILIVTKIIIWDECTMAHKRALEALDGTLKDLRKDSRCIGGAMVLLSGDLRQTLPVISRSIAADEINACLK